MFPHKIFKKLLLSLFTKKPKNLPVKEKRSFLYIQLYKYIYLRKILMNRLYFLYLSKKDNSFVMFDENVNEEDIKKELMILLEEGYQALSNIYLGENQLKAIDELSKEEATNVVQWIEQFFIEGFVKMEEYEKCSLLKEFAEKIKSVKQLNIN